MGTARAIAVGLLAVSVLALAGCDRAAEKQASQGRYDPRRAFAPLTLPVAVNSYRAGDGAPGPDYWQNRADYKIAATLDPAKATLAGDEVITYTNNSPTALTALWVQLDENIYKKDARARTAAGTSRRAAPQSTDGFVLDKVEIGEGSQAVKAETVISDTRMQVRLPEALKAKGGQIKLHIAYHYTVPKGSAGRTGHDTAKDGEIFDLAQWYPRMAVFDDLRGWDTLPYIASEFYLEYGDFDVAMTVPSDMLVAGSGELTNPQEVLTKAQQDRLAQARQSDKTVMIRTAAEINDPASRPKQDGTLTWRFHMTDSRDVAFIASKALIWDAARINLPGGKTALAQSLYPVEGAEPKGWGRSTEYLKHAVENFSKRWSVYPWPVASSLGGPIDGMEYPGVAFDSYKDRDPQLFWITAHEIGHTWFPMVVGFNERRDQWMDEGFNTFIDIFESDDFKEFGPKRDGEYAPGKGNPVDEILPLLADREAPVMMTRSDQVREKYRHPSSYFKSALGLVLLREQILGPERFDFAFKKFIADWSFKHPTPSDFFRAMNSAGGEDLSWFWRGWYFNNWNLDLAVTGAVPAKEGWDKGAVVTVANRDRLVMPSTVEVAFAGGEKRRIALPAETWLQKSEVELRLDSTKPILSVTVDPDHVVPDRDRANNVLKPGG
ncbi:MAG: M1 family metallopeptidase [Alphaproteobacteria bacterium]|nr:M1 family metallopeptidase [Alphaproteobacteria bacterium]